MTNSILKPRSYVLLMVLSTAFWMVVIENKSRLRFHLKEIIDCIAKDDVTMIEEKAND